jgi:ribonuclease D
VLSSVEEIPESLVQRGAKSAESPLSPDCEGPADVNTTDAKVKKTPRILVSTLEHLSGVVADLQHFDLVALDLETTVLNPRKDSIRLLSLATKDVAYIVECQSVDPARLFPILTGVTVVAHNALFDLGFLSSLAFEPGKVADTMILSQLLHAGARVEPLKRGQTSHRLDSVVKRELGLELDKTHQSSDWGAPLRLR